MLQGCILSPTLFLFYLEKIVNEALEGHDGGVKIGDFKLTNLKFADDIDLVDRCYENQHEENGNNGILQKRERQQNRC